MVSKQTESLPLRPQEPRRPPIPRFAIAIYGRAGQRGAMSLHIFAAKDDDAAEKKARDKWAQDYPALKIEALLIEAIHD